MSAATDRRHLERVAMDLAEHGYRVFPCRPRGKAPLISSGFKSATCDERTILHWWDRFPDANVGVACEASGICVLDIDPKHGADPDKLLATELGLCPDVLTGVAPERCEQYPNSLPGLCGVHVYFRGEHRTCETTIRGVELRGAGAYVIAPGSIHESGRRYELRGVLPAPYELPELPESVLAILPKSTVHARSTEHWRELTAAGAPVGERNIRCAQLAGHLLARGVDGFVTLELVHAWNRCRNRPPLPDDEVTQTVGSIATREAAKWTR